MHRTLVSMTALCIAVLLGYLVGRTVAPPSPSSDRPAASAPTPIASGQDSPKVDSPSGNTTPSVTGAEGSPALRNGATVVSLTFDDGSAYEYASLDILRSHRMHGTFYINTALVGSSAYYMTWSQVEALAAAGNEIAGHTLHHVNIAGASPAKERSEVCDDRQALIASRLGGVSFAYPEGALDPRAQTVVRSCGYQNARRTGGLWYPGCAACPPVETIPPANRYGIRTAPPATTATTLADLQASVLAAESHGGGWLPMVFHGICNDRCTGANSLSPAVFDAFLDWLGPRTTKGTVVRTVAQVMSARR